MLLIAGLLFLFVRLLLGGEATSIYASPDVQEQFSAIYDEKMTEWPVPYEDRYLDTEYGKVLVIVSGPEDGPPLLLLHASGVASWSRKYNIAELSQHYRAYAIDLIGDAGKSELASMDHILQTGADQANLYAEIGPLFHRDDDSFGRKLRKLNSILAGEASAAFSLLIGHHASFDCRSSQLPTLELIVDYFRWRQLDAHRNALNAHCYWTLRHSGLNAQSATAQLEGLSVADNNELLFQHGLNFNDLPTWQKRGVGIYWFEVEKECYNPLTRETALTQRRKLYRDCELPMKREYGLMVNQLSMEMVGYPSGPRTSSEPEADR